MSARAALRVTARRMRYAPTIAARMLRAARQPTPAQRALERAAFARQRVPGKLVGEPQPVTRILFDRLAPEQVAEVQERAADAAELAGLPGIPGDGPAQRELTLQYGAWLAIPSLLQRTGLVAARAPDHIHAMVHGPQSGAGGLYEADMVIGALLSAGADPARVRNALDFGCSSGRVLRVLRAAFPDTQWQGCDPNRPAVEWAAANLPGIDFSVSPQHPPLDRAEGTLDLVYAISIWSHFAPALGLTWFAEMHRLLAPGGYLVFTTHGPESVGFYVAAGKRWPEQAREILDSLYAHGTWYAPEFGSSGDDGVVDPEWGTAFLSPEWVLAELCPRWRVLEYGPGRNQRNQDVYVLQRV